MKRTIIWIGCKWNFNHSSQIQTVYDTPSANWLQTSHLQFQNIQAKICS